MDTSFSLQALSLLHVIDHAQVMGPHVYNVPREIDERIARLRLKAIGVGIDTLTDEQTAYLASWNE
jgi:adenosylhomocysteinase